MHFTVSLFAQIRTGKVFVYPETVQQPPSLIHDHLCSQFHPLRFSLEGKVIPGITMKDTSFTRYLLRSLLCRPPKLDSNPAEETVIYAHPPDLPRRARHYVEGMKMLNNRLLTRSYYEAFKHLSDTTEMWNRGWSTSALGLSCVAARKSENPVTCDYLTSPLKHFVPVVPSGCVTLRGNWRILYHRRMVRGVGIRAMNCIGSLLQTCPHNVWVPFGAYLTTLRLFVLTNDCIVTWYGFYT